LSSFDDPPFGQPSPVTFSYRRLGTRHLSHDALSAFAFLLLCSQSRCSSHDEALGHQLLWHKNLRRRSDAVLDQRLVDKIHSPSTNPPRPVVLWAPVIPFLENTHLTQMYFYGQSMPTRELLVALDVISDLFPASLPSGMTEFHLPGIRS